MVNVRAETERGVVGQLDCLVLRRHLEDHRDRPEELLPEGRVVRADVGQHAGRVVRAVALTATDQRRAAGDGLLHLGLQPLGGGERGERRDAVALRQRQSGDLLHETVVEVLGHDEALGRVAGLAGVVEPGIDGGLDRTVEIIGGQQHERVGPAELQHDLLQVPTGDLGHGRGRPLEPVEAETPATRGSAMMVAAWSLVAYTFTYAPGGKPASS